jgi:hypothetical protein
LAQVKQSDFAGFIESPIKAWIVKIVCYLSNEVFAFPDSIKSNGTYKKAGSTDNITTRQNNPPHRINNRGSLGEVNDRTRIKTDHICVTGDDGMYNKCICGGQSWFRAE